MAETQSEQLTEGTGESSGPPPLSHKVPPPQDMSKSKLDWLLQINEDYFQDQLKTVVSNISTSYPSFLAYWFNLHSKVRHNFSEFYQFYYFSTLFFRLVVLISGIWYAKPHSYGSSSSAVQSRD